MADSYRLRVLKALTLLLEGTEVTPVANVEPVLPTTLAGLVFRGRSVFGVNDPATMLSILETPRPGGAQYTSEGDARLEDWSLLIQGWCPDDKDHPTDPLYSLMDDVEKRLTRITAIRSGIGQPKYESDYMLGRLITRFQVTPGVVRPPAEGISSKAFFYLPVQVGIARIGVE